MQSHFDSDSCGKIHWSDFMKAIRGGEVISEARNNCIRKAYDALCKDGVLTLDTIAQAFDASKAPGVGEGEKDERETYMTYMGSWDTQERDGVISWDEFLAVHSDVSLGVSTDEAFHGVLSSIFRVAC
jgi:hypothetical protein